MTFSQLVYLSVSFVLLFGIGTFLCLMQAHWNSRKFFRSSLWTKIVFWIPIFAGFLAAALFGTWCMILVWSIVILQALREWHQSSHKTVLSTVYLLFFVACSVVAGLHFFIVPQSYAIDLLILICFTSALSDITAYFFGTFLGRHPLPKALNPRKSWEGVIGQIAGAPLGLAVVAPIIHLPDVVLLALFIGCASAFGDLLNSAAKRSIGSKDWGQTIPGHGGVLDRFSSLSAAFLFGILAVYLVG